MIVTMVHVHVKSAHIEDFITATVANHVGSIREPANQRFDVLQDPEDPTRFVLYEAYQTAEGAAAHKKTAHYLAWREAVAPWMASPRRGVPHTVLAP